MSDKDGGPAFPVTPSDRNGQYATELGMTLRDYAALHAPADEIRDIAPNKVDDCAAYIGIASEHYLGSRDYIRVLAKARYAWADAMLKERTK
jgi:hypothetical protein